MIQVEGLDLVQGNLRRVRAGFGRERQRIHGELGKPIVDRARGRARVRTGRLRASIQLRSTPDQVEVTADAPYAGYQHWGTRYVSGTRFLTEPFEELEGFLVRDYQQKIEQWIGRVWVDS